VSVSTASLAFSGAGPVTEATRAKVLAAAASLDYGGPDPRARSLRQGRSGIIGVVMEDRLRDAFRDPMNIALLDGLADEAGVGGVGLLLLTDHGTGDSGVAIAPMDAVVLVGCGTRLDASVETLRRRGIPMVAIEAEHMDGVLAIDLDNRVASRTAARHLKRLGHDRVAVVALPIDSGASTGALAAGGRLVGTGFTALERLRGVREVYPGVGGWVAGGSSVEEGMAAGLALLAQGSRKRSGRPTAIIAQSDLLAVGVIRAAESLGLQVPGDLSVIGFDGARIDGAEAYDLTTLVQPAVEKGRAAGRAILELLAGGSPSGVAFSSVFHEGNTTAPVLR
jgi:DNA-binding LacI/PurR family transcriptional regulator